MAGRILNRRELREQADHPEVVETTDADAETQVAKAAVPKKKKTKAKVAGPPKVRKPRAKKAPPRMRARWGIFDAGMKQVAVFDYNQRAVAEEKLADIQEKKKGFHFLQIVKEQMADPIPVEAAAVG
jgi:hypothetical protein